MKLNELLKYAHIVPAVQPVDFNTGVNAGDWVSMENYAYCLILISIGVSTGTAVVTLDKAASVSGGTTTLAFTKYFRTGQKLPHGGYTGTPVSGETVTGGTSGATGKLKLWSQNGLWVHTVTGTAFTSGETVTGGTSGFTAVLSSAAVDEDIMLEDTASSDTFTIPAVSNRQYEIPIDADTLGEGYNSIQLDIAQASQGCIGNASYIMFEPRNARYPMDTAIYNN